MQRYQAGFAAMGDYAYSRRSRQVSYQRYAGRWYLKRVWDQAVNQQPGREYQHTSEFITTAIDTAKGRRPAYADRFRPEDVFLRNSVAYDSTFWQNFTTLVLPRQVEQQLLDEERQRKAEQLFSDSTAAARPAAPDTVVPAPASLPVSLPRRRSFLERFSYSSSLAVVPLQVSGGQLDVAYAPAGSAFAARSSTQLGSRRVSVAPRFDYLFWLNPRWQLHYGAGSIRGALQGGLQGAGLRYLHNLSQRRRPVYVRMGLEYSRTVLRQRLGRFSNPDADLRVRGTPLNANRVAVGLQSITKGLAPQLGLEVKLASTLYLFAEASYCVPLATHSELLLEEKQGFFLSRSTARVPLTSPEVLVQLNGQERQTAPFLPRPLLLRVGIAVGGH
ncbi:hypothetical protein HMJ29_00845 [Hymenobacter taeanensis]|uniref:Uncharacterized protein n=1 Tax=Hymenobacter taeanensis TaxID=2735321 RepID=A0A6M6BEA5_9BACT|nr:hypothetical protein [Hymenobacter taeanensis]QJX45563.1 hypothetical protein HMJ29_00845 [Hymenobacter taeanensis]